MATKELIYKDDARRAVLKANPSIAFCIDNIKAVDAVEVVHGKWEICVDEYDCEFMRCSVCEEMFYDGDNDTVDCLHNDCPNCGADMRGEEDG